MNTIKRPAIKRPAVKLSGNLINVKEEFAMEKNILVVINERFGYCESIFTENVSAEELSATIEEQLVKINALMPVTYAHDLPMFLQDEDQISFRIDTKDENDSHQITISKLNV